MSQALKRALQERPLAADKASANEDRQRRLMIAKVKIAQKQLVIVDDDYRAMLLRLTGKTSTTQCSQAELARVLDEMKAKGFATRAPTGPRQADHPSARKARALWISLAQLGAVRNPSEQALEAFARRQLGVARMQWADQALTYKLVEALKAMAMRDGDQMIPRGAIGDRIVILKRRLLQRILDRLVEHDQASKDWTVATAAYRLCGVGDGYSQVGWSYSDYDAAAKGMGATLRRAMGLEP